MARYRRRGNFRKRPMRGYKKSKGRRIRKVYVSRGGIRL